MNKDTQEEVLLTKEGHEKLCDELEQLETVKRHEVARRIKDAREHGDISENSEYEDAKNEQAFVEGRIIHLKQLLGKAKVMECNLEGNLDHVHLGSWVTLKDVEAGETYEYMIVGSAESDPLASKISNQSPLGNAIYGKKKGDTVVFKAPQKSFQYQIVDIRLESSQ